MIEIRSLLEGEVWKRPRDVTIRNCKILGSIRIKGMGQNGEAGPVKTSSRRQDGFHVQRLRAAAPTRITLDRLTVTGTGRTPIYLAPGVTYVTLTNSELNCTGIYLDAETAYNTIKHNYFHVKVFDEWGDYPDQPVRTANLGRHFEPQQDHRQSLSRLGCPLGPAHVRRCR